MWLSPCPDASEGLRQGDLLVDLVLLKPALPLQYVRGPGVDAAPTHPALVPTHGKHRLHVVMSQCCEIENGNTVALAPVVSTRSLREDERASYEAEEPPRDGGGGYVYDAFYLQPLPGLIEHRDGRLMVVRLGETTSYEGALEGLVGKRVACMTPAGRRLLRINLSYYWGRVENEDLAWFDSEGLPAGPSVE